MSRSRLLGGALLAALALGTPAGASTGVAVSCTYHPEYPLRKYDCTGTGLAGTWWCSAHWADSDNDGNWEEGNSRVYSIDCTGPTGTYGCDEVVAFTTYSCSATGVRGTAVCTTYEWTDNDPDSNPGTVTDTSCVGLNTILELIDDPAN